MKTLISLIIFGFFAQPFSKKPILEFEPYLEATSCPKKFEKEEFGGKNFETLISLYKVFPCFPHQSLEILEKDYKDESWIFSQLTKSIVLNPLKLKEQLDLSLKLFPYTKNSSDIEKKLLNIISAKRLLSLDTKSETNLLEKKFPSYKKTSKPSLKIAKDFKRRGRNTEALKILETLYTKSPKNRRIHRELIRTQKNIKRNWKFLFFSQRYVDLVSENYKKSSTRKNRRLYLKESLRNIRRIWTYSSTPKARLLLSDLIKNHCQFTSECAEHYWILGRIYEEQKDTEKSYAWLLKAAQNTSKSSKEYIHRVWNLIWLESKIKGDLSAFNTTKAFIHNVRPSKVSSKIYFWMSQWAPSKDEKNTYISLIKKHHPLSFYLWSPLALGYKPPTLSKGINELKKSIKTQEEKNLLTLTKLNEAALSREYIQFAEKHKKIKKNKTWKKLKALNGLYANLLSDLESGNISVSENLQYFFSRSYINHVSRSSQEEQISKELIWSIIRQESNFNTYARSWADAFGLMQILPKRAVSFKNSKISEKKNKKQAVSFVNPFLLYDPDFNIQVGSWLLKTNLKTFNGTLPLAIASYNATIDKVNEWEKKFYKGNRLKMIEEITYRETRKYVKLILRNIEIYKALNKKSHF